MENTECPYDIHFLGLGFFHDKVYPDPVDVVKDCIVSLNDFGVFHDHFGLEIRWFVNCSNHVYSVFLVYHSYIGGVFTEV